jgi:predicted ABC-type ATPase
MLERIKKLAASRRDFAFETTMASRSFAPFLRRCRKEGYEVRLVFLWLKSIRLAESRVAKRVRGGGHNIPKEVIGRRYRTGVRNFLHLYVPIADQWVVYDNSGSEPRLIARSVDRGRMELLESETWRKILKVGA